MWDECVFRNSWGGLETWGRGSKAELIVRSMPASEKTQELINCHFHTWPLKVL